MKLFLLILRYPLHFIDFFIDSKRYLKDRKDFKKLPDEPYFKKETVTTAYPDGWYPECTTEDFNKWSNYIHKQLN